MTFTDLRELFTVARRSGVILRLTYQGLSITRAWYKRTGGPVNVPWRDLKQMSVEQVALKIKEYASK